MNSAIKTYKVTIFGDQYVLASDEQESRVQESVLMVQSNMQEIAQQLSISDGKKVAVLTALQLAEKQARLHDAIEEDRLLVAKLITKLTNTIDFLCSDK